MIKIILITITLSLQILLAQSVTITYDYDDINRLKSVEYTTGQTIDYTYDKAGNILTTTTSDSSVDCDDGDPLTIDSYNDSTSSCEHIADSDGDGIVDTEDTNNNDGPYADPDTDGLLNHEDSDDDNDGMPDDYENDNGFDSLNAADANEDFDGDGATNLQEYESGTSPLDPNDTPANDTVIIPVIMYLLG